jgi:hypothetical protein
VKPDPVTLRTWRLARAVDHGPVEAGGRQSLCNNLSRTSP